MGWVPLLKLGAEPYGISYQMGEAGKLHPQQNLYSFGLGDGLNMDMCVCVCGGVSGPSSPSLDRGVFKVN